MNWPKAIFIACCPTWFRRAAPRSSGFCCARGKFISSWNKNAANLINHNVAIVRVEQLYPLPRHPLKTALADYRDGTPVFWVQEEPENMGAWRFLKIHFGDRLLERFPFAGIYRQSAASPATGSASSHRLEQEKILSQALGE